MRSNLTVPINYTVRRLCLQLPLPLVSVFVNEGKMLRQEIKGSEVQKKQDHVVIIFQVFVAGSKAEDKVV